MGTSWNTEAIKLYAYQLGKRIARQRFFRPTEMQSIGYWLFNYVRLPGVSGWNKKAYPFATVYASKNIMTGEINSYFLLLSSIETVCSGASLYTKDDKECAWVRYEFDERTDDVWKFYDGNTSAFGLFANGGIVWANYDVLNKEDGTLYLAASDPVPVYE